MIDLIEIYTQETIDRKLAYAENGVRRKLAYAENRARKEIVDFLARQIDVIESRSYLDNNEEAVFYLMVTKKLLKAQLEEWKQFRTTNGMGNTTVNDLYSE